jgi:hypothetical protein
VQITSKPHNPSCIGESPRAQADGSAGIAPPAARRAADGIAPLRARFPLRCPCSVDRTYAIFVRPDSSCPLCERTYDEVGATISRILEGGQGREPEDLARDSNAVLAAFGALLLVVFAIATVVLWMRGHETLAALCAAAVLVSIGVSVRRVVARKRDPERTSGGRW